MTWLIIVVRHTSCTASSAIELAGDRVSDVAKLFLLLVEVLGSGGLTILVEPFSSLLDSVQDL